ncbi:hypothetical protein MVEN_01563300 [Mycena venus]|uniref:Uncharacterized protein n=1 Tax=Mycena venus TaxID=2733690 RepID=A0A8H6XQV2_9AGAR|nr:hypothetical protein MVEN_01563300 [Mycena venus]
MANNVPPEIWLHVFLFATSTPYTPQLYETEYHPFHNPPSEQERSLLNLANQTVLAFSLVCRDWHSWSTQFLFETVHLSWYGTRKLQESLQRSVAGLPCGKWTRRLELSVVEHEDSDHPVSPTDIFRLCPNIEVLVKCDDDLLPHSIEGADLTGLKRFDWYYAHYRDGDHQFATEDDDRSRGQNFLRDVVENAPNLQYLSLAKRFRGRFLRFGPAASFLTLPALITLRLQSLSLDVWAEIEMWSFPRLKILRVDAAFLDLPRASNRIWDTVRVVELLQDEASISSIIPSILKICPNATELNYYIQSVYPPPSGTVFASVQVVRLHFSVNGLLHWTVDSEDELWNHIYAHFRTLKGPAFPSLKRVALYGPWDSILKGEPFALVKKDLDGRGCSLELASDEAIEFHEV